MSDTANPANLASADEFDARLKRTDEDRWLATRYAPEAGRQRLVAVYLLHQELQRALQTREGMLGKIRIQWWRETVEQIAAHAASGGAVRRHDLAQELARVAPDLIAPMNNLIDRFDDVIDDHLHGGHTEGDGHEARHFATEGSLARLAGLALDPRASADQLEILTRCGEVRIVVAAEYPEGPARWAEARSSARKLAPQFWPAILHLAAADHPDGKPRSPLSKRWRMFNAMLFRRLGK